jgi:hypothetical protein
VRGGEFAAVSRLAREAVQIAAEART